MRWDFLLFFASLAVAAIGGEWGAYLGVAGMAVFGVHGILTKLPQKAQKMAIVLGLIASGCTFVALLAFLLKPTWFGLGHSNALVEPLDNTISVSCSWSKPPSHYREDKTLHVVAFQGIPISGIDFNRQSAGPMHFIRSSDPFPPAEHYSDMWYRCDVTNHGSQPVRAMWLKFPVVYDAAITDRTGTHSGDAIAAGFARGPRLDLAAGESDYFYFANASAAFVTVLSPATAMLRTMADNKEREVKVTASSDWQVGLMPSPNPLHAPVDTMSPQ